MVPAALGRRFLAPSSRLSLMAGLYLVTRLAGLAQTLSQNLDWLSPIPYLASLNAPTPLKARASSQLPVDFAVLQGPAVMEGTQLVVTNVGSVLVEARQPGSPRYLPVSSQVVFNPLAIHVTALGSLPLGGEGRDVKVRGNFAYIASGEAGIQIVNLENPEAPRLVANVASPAGLNAYGVDVADQVLFVADVSGKLLLFDLSEPSKPNLLSSLALPGGAMQVSVRAGIAYVAAGFTGVRMIDVSDPTQPTLLGTYNSPGQANDLQIEDSLLYLADGPSGLQIVDVSNPTQPRNLSSFATRGNALGVRVSRGIAYIADNTLGLISVDVSQPAAPRRLGALQTGGNPRQVKVQDDVVLCAKYFSGLSFVDPIQPKSLRVAEGQNPINETYAFDSSADLISVVSASGELKLYRWRRGLRQSIVQLSPGDIPFTNGPISLIASATSKLPVDFSVVSGPASIVENQLFLSGEGTVNLRFDQLGDAQFFPTSATTQFRVLPNQTIAWVSPTQRVLRQHAPIPLKAEASSGLPVTYRIVQGPARIEGDQLIITNSALAGSVVVAAEQVGSPMFVPVSIHQVFNRPVFESLPATRDATGAPNRMEVVGTRGYVATQEGLRIVNLREPAVLSEVSRAPIPKAAGNSEGAIGICVAGNRAYLAADSDGLFIFDVIDPTQPRLIGQFATPGRARCVQVLGRTAYVAAGASGLLVLDVHDPANPVLVGTLSTGAFTTSLRLRGNTAYVIDAFSGLQIVDVSIPSQPRILGAASGLELSDIDIRDDLIAVMVGRFGMTILDVRNPSQPKVVGYGPDTSHFDGTGIQVQGHLAYLVGTFDGVRVVDLSDLTQPALLNQAEFDTQSPSAVQVIEGIAFYASPSKGLTRISVRPLIPQEIEWPILSTSLPLNRPHEFHPESTAGIPVSLRIISGPAHLDHGALVITNLATVIVEVEAEARDGYQPAKARRVLNQPVVEFTPLGTPVSIYLNPTSLQVAGDLAYVTSELGGLGIFDIRDPGKIVPLGALKTENAQQVSVVGDLAYVADRNEGLVILNVSQPSEPKLVSRFVTADSPQDVVVQDGRAYLATGSKGLLILDVSNPTLPVELGRFAVESPGWVFGVTVVNSTAFVLDANEGLRVLDVSNPQTPRQSAGDLNLLGTTAVRIRDHIAHLGIGSEFRTLDVSDPTHPIPLGGLNLFGRCGALALDGNWAYYAQEAFVGLVDLGSPKDPIRLGEVGLGWTVNDLAVSGETLYTIDRLSLLSAFRIRMSLRPTWAAIPLPASGRVGERFALPKVSAEGFPLQYSIVSGPGQIREDQLLLAEAGVLTLRWETPKTDLFEAASFELTVVIREPDPKLEARRTEEFLEVQWADQGALLETANAINGIWKPVAGARSPYKVPLTEGVQLFRTRLP